MTTGGSRGGGSRDTNLTNPTQHRLKWKRSQRHTTRRNQMENAFKSHSKEDKIIFNFCTMLPLRSFSKVRKKWQHCYQEFYWRMWTDSNTHQIVTFPVLSDSFWPVNCGWCLPCHLRVEAWKAQVWLSSFFPSCPRSCVFQMVHVQEPHWSQTSVGCAECVPM